MVRRIEPRQVFIDLGRAEAIMPPLSSLPMKDTGAQRLKVYLVEDFTIRQNGLLLVSRLTSEPVKAYNRD